jgi:hypothetical protein
MALTTLFILWTMILSFSGGGWAENTTATAFEEASRPYFSDIIGALMNSSHRPGKKILTDAAKAAAAAVVASKPQPFLLLRDFIFKILRVAPVPREHASALVKFFVSSHCLLWFFSNVVALKSYVNFSR